MVRIPGPEQVGRASLDRLRTPPVRAEPEDFGADIGRAVEGLGAAVVKMGERLKEKRQAREDSAFFTKGFSEGSERLAGVHQPDPQGPTGPDAAPDGGSEGGDGQEGHRKPFNLEERLEQGSVVIDEVIAGLKEKGMNPRDQVVHQLRQQLLVQNGRFAARTGVADHQQRGTQFVTELNTAFGNYRSLAHRSFESVPQALEDIDLVFSRSSQHFDEEAAASERAMMGAGIVTAGYIGLIERDPERAAKSLENGEFGEFLPERTTKQLLDFAKKGAEQQKIVSRNAAEIGWQDWITRLLKGEEDPPVPDDSPSATLDDKTRNARAAQEEAARKHAFTLKAWRFVPSEDVRRELALLKPKRGAKGFTNESFVFKKLEEVTNDMLAERAKDPAEFAMSNPRVREAFETAGDDPSRRSQAVALSLSLQEALGIAEADRRVLTNAEVNGFIAQYGVAEMDGRAGLLMDLKETHGKHFGRAVSELAKGGLDSRFSVLTRVKDEPRRFRFVAEVLAVGSVALKKHTGVSAEEAKAIDEELAAVAPGLRDRRGGDDLHAAAHDLAVHYYAQKGEAKASVSQALEMLGLPASKTRAEERGRTATRGLQPAVYRVEGEADAADGGDALAEGVTRVSFPTNEDGGSSEDETEGGPDEALQLAQAGNTGGQRDLAPPHEFLQDIASGIFSFSEFGDPNDPDQVLHFGDKGPVVRRQVLEFLERTLRVKPEELEALRVELIEATDDGILTRRQGDTLGEVLADIKEYGSYFFDDASDRENQEAAVRLLEGLNERNKIREDRLVKTFEILNWRGTGRLIKNKLIKKKPSKKQRSDPDKPTVSVPVPLVAEVFRRKFNETQKNKVEVRVSELGEGIGREDAIQAFVEAHIRGRLLPSGQHVGLLKLDPVDPKFARRAKQDTGVDLAGLTHVIDSIQVRHAFSGHGPGKETDPTQLPISPEAVSAYVDAVENYDRIGSVRKAKKGTTIAFEKDINGVMVVVEKILKGRREFSFHTMWIKEK